MVLVRRADSEAIIRHTLDDSGILKVEYDLLNREEAVNAEICVRE